MGRTHGVHAEPTTFGVKLAGFAWESRRAADRLRRAFGDAEVGKLSGAVGTYSALGPEVERATLERLGLRAEDVSTQVVPRDRHAEVLSAIALAGASLERLATEIRHLQRTEVREVEEPFGGGPEGIQRDAAQAQPDHERARRRPRPAAARLRAGGPRERRAVARARHLAFLGRARGAARRDHPAPLHAAPHDAAWSRACVCTPTACATNVELTHGALFSQSVLTALIESGMTRDDAYRVVQRNAQRAWDEQRSFRELLEADPDVAGRLDAARLDELFDYGRFVRHAPEIIERLSALEG